MFGFFQKNKQDESEIIQIVLGADRGDIQAVDALNQLYKKTLMTDSKKHSLRKKGYTPLAEAGDVSAQIWMGTLSNEDDDGEAAERWFTMAANQGDTTAMLQLALGYSQYNTCSFGEDSEKSLYWIKKAADLGDPDAQCQLATEYASGEMIEQDHEAAYVWYQKAADQNYPEAFLYLGELYSTDEPWNTHFNFEESKSAFVKAMESRIKHICVKASIHLAQHYAGAVLRNESDTITTEDANSAIYWLCQSFWFGNRGATAGLKRIMDLTGISVSADQSQEWRYHYRNPEDDDT